MDAQTNSEATEPHDSALLDVAALARHLCVTERFVRRLVQERRIPHHKIGKFIRFHPTDIDDWVESTKVEHLA